MMPRRRGLAVVVLLVVLGKPVQWASLGWKLWPARTTTTQVTAAHGHHEESIFEEFVDEVKLCPWLLFAEISLVLLLSALFEQLQHWIREHLDRSGDKVGMQIMDVLFKEFSGLGFVGMFLFLVTQSHITADVLARKVFGHHLDQMGTEDPVAESFETVHMMIFLLMAVLLFQAMAMLRVTQGVIETWGRYERARAWGLREDSLESLFCDGGYLERVASETAPRGLELKFREDFTYQMPFLHWMVLHHDLLHNLVMWRAIRHQFIFGTAEVTSGQISCPRQFSFEAYLRERLGHIVVCVVEVDRNIWLMTLLVLTPLVYSCLNLDLLHVGEVLCLSAYSLLFFGLLVGHILETDTLWLTPTLPADARKILILFSGTSTYMLMKHYDSKQIDAELKFGAPGLEGLEEEEARLGKPPVSHTNSLRITSVRYAFIFELLAFWQAIQVTCLVLFYLTVSFETWRHVLFYALAWAEWPLMLFGVMPVLLERLTLRSSIGEETDEGLVRRVSLETKSKMLRYHVRLAQLKGYEERQEQRRPSIQGPLGKLKSPVRAAVRAVRLFRQSSAQIKAQNTWQHGLRLFRALPYSEQHEIEQIFSSLDINNNEEVMLQDLAAHWKAMGFLEARQAAEKLLESIDYDGSKQLTWSKFQAVAALAITEKGDIEHDDYSLLFRLIDRHQNGRITVFEIASWLEDMKSGMTEVDVASLLYQHFGQAKPSVDKHEFVQWIAGIGLPQKGPEAHH